MLKKNQGSGMLMVMVLVTLLSLMTFIAGQNAAKHSRDSLRAGLSNRARYAARAGLEEVMNQLGHDDTYVGNAAGNIHQGNIYQSPHLRYEVVITNNSAGQQAITSPDGTTVEPGSVHLRSKGEEVVSTTKTSIIGMVGIAFKTHPNFNHGAYANGFMSVENTEVDAWDAVNHGSYMQRVGAFTTPPPAGEESTVGGRAALPMSLRLLGTSKLDGQVMQGAGTQANLNVPPVHIDGSAVVAVNPAVARDPYGTKIPKFRAPFHSSQVGGGQTISPPPPPNNNNNNNNNNPPPPPPPPPVLSPGAYQFLDVRPGGTVRLQSGVYYFEDYMHLDRGRIRANLNGAGDPVVIFVGKEAQILNNSKINEWGETDDVQIVFTDELVAPSAAAYQADLTTIWDAATAQQIAQKFPANPPPGYQHTYSKMIVDDSEVVGAIAGSQLEATVRNNSELFGAVMGKDIRAVDSEIHQDLSLKGARLMTGADWNLGGVHEIKL